MGADAATQAASYTRLRICAVALTDIHLMLPETESVLKVNLDQDVAATLSSVERPCP